MLLKFRIAECNYFLKYYNKALEQFNLIEDQELKKYKLLSFGFKKDGYLFNIYQNLGNNDKAYYHAKKWQEAFIEYKNSESIAIDNAKDNIHNEEITKYLSENQKLKSKNLKFQKLLIVISTVSVLCLLSFYIYQKKRKKKFINIITELESKQAPLQFITVSKISKVNLSKDKTAKLLEAVAKLEKEEAYLNYNFNIQAEAKKINNNYI